MFPIKTYYEKCIKNEIIGVKRDAVLKRLSNLLACHVISKDTKEVVHFRYFTCTDNYQPTDKWIGTIAVKFKNGYATESAVSVPENK